MYEQHETSPSSAPPTVPVWLKITRKSISAYERETLVTTGGSLRSSSFVAKLLEGRARVEEVECFYVIALSAIGRPIALQEISRGTPTTTWAEPREVFRAGVLLGAAWIVVAHNHPSGDPSPSPDDIRMTRGLVSAGRILGIEVLDHVILAGGPDLRGGNGHFSFKDHDLLTEM